MSPRRPRASEGKSNEASEGSRASEGSGTHEGNGTSRDSGTSEGTGASESIGASKDGEPSECTGALASVDMSAMTMHRLKPCWGVTAKKHLNFKTAWASVRSEDMMSKRVGSGSLVACTNSYVKHYLPSHSLCHGRTHMPSPPGNIVVGIYKGEHCLEYEREPMEFVSRKTDQNRMVYNTLTTIIDSS